MKNKSAEHHPVDSSDIERADVELDWTPVFDADDAAAESLRGHQEGNT